MSIQLKGSKKEIAEAKEIRKSVLPLVEKAVALVEQNGLAVGPGQKIQDINLRTAKFLKALHKIADASFWIENFSGLGRYVVQTQGALENAKAAEDPGAIELFSGYIERMPRDLAQRLWDKCKADPDEVEDLLKKVPK